MALVVFLRAVNVGGHNTFRPSILAKELSDYDVVNIGAAGTYVVRKAVSQEKFRRALLDRLGFPTDVMICEGRALAAFAADKPFADHPLSKDVVGFVNVLLKPLRTVPKFPMQLPDEGEWVLKILGCRDQFVFGLYKRQMKAITYLGRVEKLIGVPATTRNWNTINAILKTLQT